MSSGEERLAETLVRGLGQPPWAIYRNVAWLEKRPGDEPADGEADVVLAHPDLGVMVIEVKGGRVQRIGGRWESVDRDGRAHAIKNPFAQVTRAMHRLRRVCGGLPAWPAHDVRFTRAVAFPVSALRLGGREAYTWIYSAPCPRRGVPLRRHVEADVTADGASSRWSLAHVSHTALVRERRTSQAQVYRSPRRSSSSLRA